MYFFHSWADLDDGADDELGLFASKARKLREIAAARLGIEGQEIVHNVNFSTIFQCSAQHNRRLTYHDDLLSVLQWICKELPGSHGLTYWSDDEIPGAQHFDGYRVIVMRRGLLEERFDPFLSPTKPVTEDFEGICTPLEIVERPVYPEGQIKGAPYLSQQPTDPNSRRKTAPRIRVSWSPTKS